MAQKKRFKLKVADGNALVDSDGNVLGKLVGLTVDVRVGEGETFKEGGVGSSQTEPSEQEQTKQQDGGVGEGIATVWMHYVEAMQPRDTTLHDGERKLIREALKVASVSECCRAIDGNKASGWHQGENDRGKKYNRISHILKGKQGKRTLRENIDLFLEIAEQEHADLSAADAHRITRAKREVQQAAEMPESIAAQERGQRARSFLEQHGWRVIEEADGRLGFERDV